jgi:hypothetical protein
MLDIALQLQTPLIKRSGSVKGVAPVRRVEPLDGDLTAASAGGRLTAGPATLSPYSNLLKYASNVDFIKDRSQLLSSRSIRELVRLRNELGEDEEAQRFFGNALISLATRNPSSLGSFLEDTNKLIEMGDRDQVIDYFNYVISSNVRPVSVDEGEEMSEDFPGEAQKDAIPRAVTIRSETEDFNEAIQSVLKERLERVREKVGSLDFASTGATIQNLLGQGLNLIRQSEPSSYVVFSLLS